jgi:hypothetical protein
MFPTKAITAVWLLALTCAAAADEKIVPYNVGPGGACSPPIAIPANNKGVFIVGTSITPGDEGQGHVSLLRTTGSNQIISWAGADFANGPVRGLALGTETTRIMSLNYAGNLDLLTAPSAHLMVCSAKGAVGRSIGYLTFTY